MNNLDIRDDKKRVAIREIGWTSEVERDIIEGWIRWHNIGKVIEEVRVRTGRELRYNVVRRYLGRGWIGRAIKEIEEKRLMEAGYTYEDWFRDGYASLGREDGKIRDEVDVQIWKEIGKSKRFTGSDAQVSINVPIDLRQSDGRA